MNTTNEHDVPSSGHPQPRPPAPEHAITGLYDVYAYTLTQIAQLSLAGVAALTAHRHPEATVLVCEQSDQPGCVGLIWSELVDRNETPITVDDDWQDEVWEPLTNLDDHCRRVWERYCLIDGHRFLFALDTLAGAHTDQDQPRDGVDGREPPEVPGNATVARLDRLQAAIAEWRAPAGADVAVAAAEAIVGVAHAAEALYGHMVPEAATCDRSRGPSSGAVGYAQALRMTARRHGLQPMLDALSLVGLDHSLTRPHGTDIAIEVPLDAASGRSATVITSRRGGWDVCRWVEGDPTVEPENVSTARALSLLAAWGARQTA